MIYQVMKDELTEHGYSEFRYLSEGLQGYVVLAKERFTNKRFAIKGIPVRDLNGIINQNKLNQVQQEMNMLEQCKGSPYVSNLVKSIEGKKFTFLVLTECQGTLKELIDSTPGQKLNELSAIKYCKDIAQGLHFIHSKQCIVNDLKFDNILIDYNGNAVISDFGFAQTLPKNSGYSIVEYMGNFYFQAPECYDPKVFKVYDDEYKQKNIQTQMNPSQRSEACSLGYLLYVMIQGFYSDLAFKKHLELPYDQTFQTFKYKKQLRYIIDGLTQFAPRERLSVEEVLILLKGIISFEFDLDSKFVELINQETQEQANQLNQEIEFIQNFNNKYYPIFKDEDNTLQECQQSLDGIEKLIGYSKTLEYQIQSLKALQVETESKIEEQQKIIRELETKINKLTEDLQKNQQIEAQKVVQQIHQQNQQAPQVNENIQEKQKCKCEAKGKCHKKAIECSKCGHKFCQAEKDLCKNPITIGLMYDAIQAQFQGGGGYEKFIAFMQQPGCKIACCKCKGIQVEVKKCEFDCDCEFCKKKK